MILTTIKSGLEAIRQVFRTWQVNVEHNLEKVVIKDKKDLKKASNITEDILEITDKYTKWFSKEDLKNYKKLKKRFLKVN